MLHIVTSKYFDFHKIAHDAAAGLSPSHILIDLAKIFPSQFHQPTDSLRPTSTDKLRGKLFSRPNLWTLARQVAAQVSPDDMIYCTGEDIGLPLAHALSHLEHPPKIAVTIHNLNRPRARLALRLFHSQKHIDLWLTPTPSQSTFLQNRLHIPKEKIHLLPEQTDTNFYKPSSLPASKHPLIASVGLEQRDYRTLAAATHDLPLSVKISGFSNDATALRKAFPDPMPVNMSRQFYSWPDLLRLYHSADLIVIPLFQNQYLAGITTLLEALACQRPVIITQTQGLAPYTNIPNICLTVPPHNPAALRAAIQHLLQNPPLANSLAQTGQDWLQKSHTPTHWLTAVAFALHSLTSRPQLSYTLPQQVNTVLSRVSEGRAR